MRRISFTRPLGRLVVVAMFAALAVVLTLLLESPPRALAEPAGDQTPDIKGTWIFVSGVEGGEASDPEKTKGTQMTIDETNLVLNAGGDHVEKCTYKLDASKSPMWLDLSTGESPAKHIYAICELKDGTLKLCFMKDGGPRPADFNATAANHLSLLIFKRPGGGGGGDGASLVGNWGVIDAIKRGEQQSAETLKTMSVTIDAQNLSINTAKEKNPVGYKLDASHSPAWIDLMDGEIDIPGIYQLKDGVLKICFSKNKGTRPTEFAADRENQYSLLVLKPGAAPTSQPWP